MSLVNHKLISEAKTHATFDLRGLLIPWFMFRAYIQLKPEAVRNNNRSSTCTRYGDEHDVTYKQCIAGHVDKIILTRLRGYENLINMIEKGVYRNKYSTVKIYGREPGHKNFNLLHRTYVDGKLQKEFVQDPEISVDDYTKTLFFFNNDGRLHITEEDPAKNDFKSLIDKL